MSHTHIPDSWFSETMCVSLSATEFGMLTCTVVNSECKAEDRIHLRQQETSEVLGPWKRGATFSFALLLA